MSDPRRGVLRLCACAVTAALYAAMTVILAPISYGPVQLRISEILCVLPYFAPVTGWGLTLGCAAANLITGSVPDVVFGSMATALAAVCTAGMGKMPHNGRTAFLACLMPVIFNGLIVGAVLTRTYAGLDPLNDPGAYLGISGWVALGEAAVLLLPGMAAIRILPKYRVFNEFTEKLRY